MGILREPIVSIGDYRTALAVERAPPRQQERRLHREKPIESEIFALRKLNNTPRNIQHK